MMDTEKQGLTKREKVLLLLMVVVGITAVMVMFFLLPWYNQLNDKSAEYNDLQFEKSQVDISLATEAVIRSDRDAAAGQYGKDSARFLNQSLSNEISRMLTGMCEDHGLSPVSQQLASPKAFSIEESDDKADPVFLIVSAQMTVRGEYENLKSLLDTVEHTEYIRISRLAFSKNPGELEPALDRITVYFEVTMLKEAE